MSDSRGILVTGIGHSGTSATAGMLHKAGVYMGRNRTHYEDQTWWTLTRRIYQYTNNGDELPADILGTTPKYNPNYSHGRMRGVLLRQVQRHIERLSKRAIWGIKQPIFAQIWPHIESLFGEDTRIVVCDRDPAATLASLQEANHDWRDGNGELYFRQHMDHLARMVEETKFPVYTVRYEDLCADPEGQGTALIAWCFDGLKKRPKANAWKHIDSTMMHHGEAVTA